MTMTITRLSLYYVFRLRHFDSTLGGPCGTPRQLTFTSPASGTHTHRGKMLYRGGGGGVSQVFVILFTRLLFFTFTHSKSYALPAEANRSYRDYTVVARGALRRFRGCKKSNRHFLIITFHHHFYYFYFLERVCTTCKADVGSILDFETPK